MGVPSREEQLVLTGLLIAPAVAPVMLPNQCSQGTGPATPAPCVPPAPKVTKGETQGGELPLTVPSFPLLSLRGSVSWLEERRRMVGLVPGMGGRGAHREQEEA